MAPTVEQARIVANLKSAAALEVSIPIVSNETAVAGFLTPVTHQMATDAAIVSALFRWRREHMEAFLTVFVPTLEKTRGYLKDFSLSDPARLLFLITDLQRRYVGHIGLCNIGADGAEIDNVIRGEPIDVPNFMVFAHIALLGWAFTELDIPIAYLNVLEHNKRAINTYQKVGLIEISRTPLVRQDLHGGYRLVPAADSEEQATGLMLVRMELRRDSFYHWPWR